MFSKDFEVCRFGVESDLRVCTIAEGFVAGAAASAQGSEHLSIKVDEVWTVFRRLDLYCMRSLRLIQWILFKQRKRKGRHI